MSVALLDAAGDVIEANVIRARQVHTLLPGVRRAAPRQANGLANGFASDQFVNDFQ